MSSEESRMTNEGGGQMPARPPASTLAYPARRDRSHRANKPRNPSDVGRAARDAAKDEKAAASNLGSTAMIGGMR